MPQYKVMYFNGKGSAERIRLLLALADQEFEDYRFKEGEWPEIKGDTDKFPLGQAPVLIIDGKAMPQSRAICQKLARDFKLYGANNDEASQIDVLQDTVNDVGIKLGPLYFEQDATKKAEGIAKAKESMKPSLNFINNQFKAGGGRFFVGNSESLSDVVVFSLLDGLFEMLGEDYVKGNFADLIKFRDGITNNSKLSAYIKARPQTPF